MSEGETNASVFKDDVHLPLKITGVNFGCGSWLWTKRMRNTQVFTDVAQDLFCTLLMFRVCDITIAFRTYFVDYRLTRE
jgi:hypothetical protein